jgi:LytS/YehU family sensor histidine kinase
MILFLILESVLRLMNGEGLKYLLHDFFISDFKGWFRSTISGLSIGALIFVILLWQTSLRREQKLREQNLIFQNQTLKNQINPHFLFNSLNTLSALIPEHPDSAERFILKLSSIYRYILENSPKDSVPLKSELDFINDYFILHEVRDEGKIQLTIDARQTENFRILPVSLQILVENAIKHNMATRGNPLQISITADDNYISVRNNLQKMAVKLKSTEIGLKNLRERVRLSTGKDLIVEETNKEFIVKVPLMI